MPRPYSNDLRARVIEAIEAGASRREVADRYELSPSVVVIWAQRWEETGSVAAKPSGGSTSPLEEHAEFLLRLIVEQPDLTLDEIVAAMRKKRIPGSRSAVWRFFERRNISFKKNFVRGGAKARGNRPRAGALDATARQVRSGPIGVYRRDLDEHQHGAAANYGCCRRRHRHETSDLHASTATNGRSASECHAKWLDRPSNGMQEPAMPEVALISGRDF